MEGRYIQFVPDQHPLKTTKPATAVLPVMHTRSATKKLMQYGSYPFTSLSETGEGILTRFEYGDCDSPDQSSEASISGSSFSSNAPSLTSSLSSISSGSSSNQSTVWDSYHNVHDFVPSASLVNHAPRQLQRTSAQHWVRDSETGHLSAIDGNDPQPSVRIAGSDGGFGPADQDEIFEREYRIAMARDKLIKQAALEKLNEDIAHDMLHMHIPVSAPSVPEIPRSDRKPLEWEGTEFVDESFRAPPGDPAIYPQQWVTNQSTLLRSQPTELLIS